MQATSIAAAVIVFVACTGAAVAQPTFQGVGFLPGLSSSRAYGISADGRYVVGDSTTAGNVNYRAFRWSQQGGMEALGVSVGGTISQSAAASADGSVIAARGPAPFPPGSFGTAGAARWSSAAGMVNLGNYSNGLSTYQTFSASGVSADGSVLVGSSQYFANNLTYGFLWTSQGFRTLSSPAGGMSASAAAVSADGLRAVGSSGSSSGERAVRWEITPGTGGIAGISLGTLAGGSYSTGTAISQDGLTIVGYGNTGGATVPWRWTAGGGMVSIGLPIGAIEARARGVSGDGSVIVGNTNSGAQSKAFLWCSTTGTLDLNTYLPTLGLDLTGWSLRTATGISSDGRVIVGSGIYGGIEQGWVATIPAPGSACLLALAGVACLRRRR